MKSTLLMKTEAPISLNFLVYVQNIFLNRNRSRNEMKFPYITSKFEFREDFDMRYRELWNVVSKRIAEHSINFLEDEKNIIYQGLFAQDDNTLNEYNEIYRSFIVWWRSIAGGFSVERSVDEIGQQIYTDLASLLVEKGIQPQKEFIISYIYDECLLFELEPSSYYAVVSIRDCFMNYKGLVQKLQQSILLS
ncbi:hypothetical protein P4H66_06470 [Paenibacillus dokdonensis]|uniref:Group-specific protein n=1 Tax=Paenibacillus dokdonensis TaxID=2567944 RepID=A0ABU6GIC7_9BACL|nr:hypothetical protein [Paenibacillus dokdonensis]MEC0239499.1 hypothetical protein [Paenibacillus dokdonensis]